MTRISLIVLTLTAFLVSNADAQNRTHRRRGALLGGLAGAAIGAAIGDKGDNETAGALIGGAVGAIAGGTIGDQKDQRIEHHRQYHSYGHTRHQSYPVYQQPSYGGIESYRAPYYSHPGHQPAYGTTHQYEISGPLSPLDVVSLVRRGTTDPSIVHYVNTYGVSQRLSVNDVIALHDHGVSQRVINAMQAAPILGGHYTTHGYPSQPSLPADVHYPGDHGYQSQSNYPSQPSGPELVAPRR